MFQKSGNCYNNSLQNTSSTNQGQYHTTQTPNLNTQKDDTCMHKAYVPTTDNCAAALAAICRLSTGKARFRSQFSPVELSMDEVALRQVFL